MALRIKNTMLLTRVGNDIVAIRPHTHVKNVEGGVAAVNGIKPDEKGNIRLSVVAADIVAKLFEQ